MNSALVTGGVIAESVTMELPRLEDRFLEIIEEGCAVPCQNPAHGLTCCFYGRRSC